MWDFQEKVTYDRGSVQAKETLKKLPKQKNNTNDLPRPFKKLVL